MKAFLFIGLIFSFSAFGQIQFDEKVPVGPGPLYVNFMAPVQTGELAFADIDGDSDMDVLFQIIQRL